jgi:large subunit ribosomal protein L27
VGVVLNRGEKLPRDEEVYGRSRHFGLVNLAELEYTGGDLVYNTLAEVNP